MTKEITRYIYERRHAFCIDTGEYAGNFERPMCAYLTGQYGVCEVGKEIADEAIKSIPETLVEEIEESISLDMDEHGNERPVGIGPTPGFFNDGHGGHYPDSEWGEPHVKESLKRRLKEEMDCCDPTHWTYEEAKKRYEEAEPRRYPAYQTVEIYFNKRPSDELLDFMMRRARECEADPDLIDEDLRVSGFSIIGFRLIEETLVRDSEKLEEPSNR